MSTQIHQFIAPKPLAPGEIVRDPATGRHGYARNTAGAGSPAEMVCGDVFVECVSDALTQAGPGAPLFIVNGLLAFTAPDAGAVPCAEVVRVESRDAAARNATVMLRTL